MLVELLKRLLFIVIVVAALYFFYRIFVAETVEPFINQHKGNIDFIQKDMSQRDLPKDE